MASSIGNSGMRKGLFFLVVYGHEVAEYADQYQWRYKEIQKIIDFYAAKDMLFFTYFLIPCWFPWVIDFIHHNYKLNKIRIMIIIDKQLQQRITGSLIKVITSNSLEITLAEDIPEHLLQLKDVLL